MYPSHCCTQVQILSSALQVSQYDLVDAGLLCNTVAMLRETIKQRPCILYIVLPRYI